MTSTILVLAERNVLRILRNSGSLISASVIPGMFLLAIYVVFSSVMELGGFNYAQYLVPAAMIQAILFTAGGSAMAIAVDKSTGLNDRLRTLPIRTAAPVIGRLMADLCRALISSGIVIVIGALLGFRFHGGTGGTIVFILVTFGFAVAASMLYDGIAMQAGSAESSASVLQAVSIPLVMLSTAYVPAAGLPESVRPVIEALPVSVVGELLRQGSSGTVTSEVAWVAVAWIGGSLLLGAALSARAFRRRV